MWNGRRSLVWLLRSADPRSNSATLRRALPPLSTLLQLRKLVRQRDQMPGRF